MQVDLSKKEIELINDALQAWEQQPVNQGFQSGLFACLLVKDEQLQKQTQEKIQNDAMQKQKQRETISLLLRAKLAQTTAIASEHEVV